MSLVVENGIFAMTLLRSLLIAALAVAIARRLQPLLANRRLRVRRVAWIFLLAPYFTPALLTGYTYANFSLSLIHHPALNIVLYSALLLWKFTPLAAVILHFTPPPISAKAIHCRRLAWGAAFTPLQLPTSRDVWNVKRRERRAPPAQTLHAPFKFCAFLLRAGCAAGPLAAFAVVFLCAFSEFEMASLMVVKSWTVSLFDAHAGGLALNESLRRVLGPLSCEVLAIALAFTVLARRQKFSVRQIAGGGSGQWFAWSHLIMAFTAVVLIPFVILLWGMVHGLSLLLENFVLGREILSSLLFAAGASAFAGAVAFWLGAAARGRGTVSNVFKTILIIAVFAGLLGPLVLSLAILAAVQLPGLIALRDTPAPLIFTLGLVLLPLALVLKRVLELTAHRSASHVAALMPPSPAERELRWQLHTRGKFWAMLLLFVWAYWDLTASAILAPVGMTPMTARLYNLMHYGQIATLSAMTCVAFAAPIFLFLLALVTRRWWAPT
jgi:ABC-type Fe3+ transport system permease subunit